MEHHQQHQQQHNHQNYSHHQQNYHSIPASRISQPDRGSAHNTAGAGRNMSKGNTPNGNHTMHDSAPVDLELDFSAGSRPPTAQEQFLNTSTFSRFGDLSMDADNQAEADMAKEDPLAAQVWKFFRKTKQNLPNQERMENLTWRMMALNLRKQKEQEEAARYERRNAFFSLDYFHFSRLSRNAGAGKRERHVKFSRAFRDARLICSLCVWGVWVEILWFGAALDRPC